MQSIRPRLRSHGDLRTGCASVVSGKEHGLDMEFFNRVRGDGNPDKGLLCLVDDVRRVNAVKDKVVVVQAAAREAYAALVAAAGVNRSRHKRSQSRPVSSVQREILDLFGLRPAAERIRRLVQLRSLARDIDLLTRAGQL